MNRVEITNSRNLINYEQNAVRQDGLNLDDILFNEEEAQTVSDTRSDNLFPEASDHRVMAENQQANTDAQANGVSFMDALEGLIETAKKIIAESMKSGQPVHFNIALPENVKMAPSTNLNLDGLTVGQLQSQRSDLLANLTDAQNQKAKLQADVDASLTEAKNNVDTAKADYDAALETKDGALNDIEVTIGDMTTTLGELRDQKTNVEADITKQNDTIGKLNESIQTQNTAVETAQTAISALAMPNSGDFTMEVQKVDSEGNAYTETVPDTVSFNAAMAEYQNQKTELESQLHDAENELASLQLELASAQDGLKELEAQASEVNQNITDATQQIADGKTAANETEQAIAENINKMAKAYQQAQEEYNSFESQSKTQLQEVEAQIEAYQSDLAAHESAIEAAEAKNNALPDDDKDKYNPNSITTEKDGKTIESSYSADGKSVDVKVRNKAGVVVNSYTESYDAETGQLTSTEGSWYNSEDDNDKNTDYKFNYQYDDDGNRTNATLYKWGGKAYEGDGSSVDNPHKYDITYKEDGITEQSRTETITVENEDGGHTTTVGNFDSIGRQLSSTEATYNADNIISSSNFTTYNKDGEETRKEEKLYDKDGNLTSMEGWQLSDYSGVKTQYSLKIDEVLGGGASIGTYSYETETGANKVINDLIIPSGGDFKSFATPTDGKLLDLNTIDGSFSDEINTRQEMGDCWLLAGVNSLTYTDAGQQLIQNAISANNDGTYTVSFANGWSHTFTDIDLLVAAQNGANTNSKFSTGDSDMFLLELAADKFIFDVEDAFANGKIDENSPDVEIYGMIVGGEDANMETGEFIQNPIISGSMEAMTALLTGKLPTVQDVVSIYESGADINETYNEIFDNLADNQGSYSAMISVAGHNYDTEYTDGTKGSVLRLTDVDGNPVDLTYDDGEHAISVKSVDGDNVTLVNPWNSNQEFTVKRADLYDFIASISYLNLA